MNNVVLIGRLTKDPELKYSQAGKAYCRFTVAVNREFNKDEADFINCLAFNKTAISIHALLKRATLKAYPNYKLTIISIHALLKRATNVVVPFAFNNSISIHALLKRATAWYFASKKYLEIFQFTLS